MLNDKQRRFVEEYLIDLNATAAYKRAGYTAKGNAAEVNAARLLRNAQVASEIKIAMDKRSEKVGRTAEDVLRDLESVKADAMQRVADKDGNMVMLDHSAAIRALELEGKHRKMWTDKTEHSSDPENPFMVMMEQISTNQNSRIKVK